MVDSFIRLRDLIQTDLTLSEQMKPLNLTAHRLALSQASPFGNRLYYKYFNFNFFLMWILSWIWNLKKYAFYALYILFE